MTQQDLVLCTKCQIVKSKENFYLRNRNNRREIVKPCKECYKEYNFNKTEEKRERHIKRTYNISMEEYNQLLHKQKGICCICKRSMRKIDIDHCHLTGKVRGLLCPECNRGLGLFYDDPIRLLSAVEYLTNAK